MRTCLLLLPALFLSTLLACSCPPPAAEPAPPVGSEPTAPPITEPAPAPAPPVPTTPPPSTDPVTPPASAELPGQGTPCAEGRCADGLECVRFYGVAGASGPEFTSCEIRCDKGAPCPAGQSCTTIADGPGTVCRAAH